MIARMGKPEDFGEDTEEEEPKKTTGQTGHSKVRPFGADYIVILTIRYWVV